MSQKVIWNNVEYDSIEDAAKSLSVSITRLRRRLMKGFRSDKGMFNSLLNKKPRGKGKKRKADTRNLTKKPSVVKVNIPCAWNDVQYDTIIQASVALNISIDEMIDRLLQGFTCDEDMGTEWASIEGYEGLYIISKLGTINRIDPSAKNTPCRAAIYPRDNETRYATALYKGSTTSQPSVIGLVVNAFLPQWVLPTDIEYLDGDISNCSVENLWWGNSIIRETRKRLKRAIRKAKRNLEKQGLSLCQKCRVIKPANSIHFHRDSAISTGLSSYCKECVADYQKANKKSMHRTSKLAMARRRARKQNLADNFSHEDWDYAVSYFNGRCAVCERQLIDLFSTHTVAADHWIPISYEGDDNPGTVPTNIVPLCHGLNGCNNSKKDTMPDVWLNKVYGKRKANKILARINEYFECVDSLNAEDLAS